MGIFGFVYFAMLNSLVPGLIFLGITLSFVMHGTVYGPQAALIAEFGASRGHLLPFYAGQTFWDLAFTPDPCHRLRQPAERFCQTWLNSWVVVRNLD
jgi:hypothetical protein